MAKTAKKPAKKGAPMQKEEKRPMVALQVDLHRTLKQYAARHDTSVKAVVDDALRKHLGLPPRKEEAH